ncbi:MAG: sugar phosphate isomerase/epimerase [Planctomycetia bacterium]|nr:sugar phosphate isomerase/epimerase [Planctomycetia bacterium]
MDTSNCPRRDFLKSAAISGVGLAWAKYAVADETAGTRAKKNIKLGIDNFAVRAMDWKGPALVDYAASLKLDTLFISDLEAYESLESAYLQDLRAKAAGQGLEIIAGTWSICPTSKVFRNKWGTAEEHLALAIRVAQDVGSPVIRVVLGNREDRLTEGGIQARIRDTVKVCQALRTRAIDAGVKIAVENHGGDMQAWELAALIEEAGSDYVGANIDSGNAVATMEDPLASLEILGPYALATSLRDSAVWESDHGATFQWTAMGDGDVDLKRYFRRFAELCPRVAVNIETISGANREIAYLNETFWKAYPQIRAKDFGRFMALVKRGKPREPVNFPDGPDRLAAEQAFQKGQLERSVTYCKEVLGLGLKS